MKKAIFGLVIFVVGVVCVGVANAQTSPAPLSAIICGAAYTNDQFTSYGGSLVVGVQSSLDASKDIFGRITYNRINIGDPTLQSINIGGVAYWYLGSKWNVYVGPGFDINLAGDANSQLTFAVGLERSIFTAQSPLYTIPFSIAGFGEVSSTEGSSQIMLGIRIAKPVK